MKNIEIKTVITDANLLITARSLCDFSQVRKYIVETAYLETKITRLINENEELKQKNKEAWIDYQKLREDYELLDKTFDNVLFCKNNVNTLLEEKFKKVVKIKCDLEKQLKHKNQLWKTAFKKYKSLKKQIKKEILELRDVFDTMKVLAIPKVYTDGDYLSTTVLKICNEALKDTEKYVKEGEK